MEVISNLMRGWRTLTTRLGTEFNGVSGLIWVVVLALTASGVGSAVLVTSLPWPLLPRLLPWPLLVLAVVAVQKMPVPIHIREQTFALDLSAVPLLIGSAMVPDRNLVLSMVLGYLTGQILRRRSRANGIRLIFNLVNQLNGVALSLLVLFLCTGGYYPVNPIDWLGLAAALVTYEVVTGVGVIAVMSASGSAPGLQYCQDLGLQLAILLPLGCAMIVIAVETYWAQPWALAVLSAPCLVVAALYRSSNNLRERLANVQSLYDFGVELERLTEMPDMVQAALLEARSILRCRYAELVVEREGCMQRYFLEVADGLLQETAAMGDLERDLFEIWAPQHFAVEHGETSVTERGFTDLVSVPLSFGDDTRGLLMAANRHGDGSGTFQGEDVSILQTLAAHLATALTSCSRLDRLRQEVAAREHDASHDGLTGLANRTLFAQMVTDALEKRSPSTKLAVMLMDLDGFKEINDTLGHHTGDAVLREVAWRVKAAVGTQQVAARLGGDEFAFLLPGAVDTTEVTETAERLLRVVAAPIAVEGMVLSVHASIGVAMAPRREGDASALLRRADVAMYSAKNSTRGLAVYDPGIDHHSPRRLLLGTELRRAVETHEGLDLWYQPVAALPSEEVVGFEALLRWSHPELGFLSPEEFIPVAEQSGLIEPLTWWVMRTALHELQHWLSTGYPMTMAVNVSVRSLFDAAIVDRLSQLLAETKVPPASVILEITESSMMLDQSRSQGVLRQLSELGVQLAIDDFGTGYSSLSRLKELPVDMVKIDRSFVKNMCNDKGDQAIVRSTIELATVMGYGVVAEGVEDLDTWEELARLGCTHAQGYFLAQPMAAETCRTWVRDGRQPALSSAL